MTEARLLIIFIAQNFQKDVKDKASIYVPAIGKVTIAILLRNLLVCESWWPSRPSANLKTEARSQ